MTSSEKKPLPPQPLEATQVSSNASAHGAGPHASTGEVADSRSLDSEPGAFDPYAFSELAVPLDLRRQMIQAQLPRLAPEYLQDTLPPINPLAPCDELSASSSSDPSPVAVPRRKLGKVVAACALIAALLLGLGIFSGKKLTRVPSTARAAATVSERQAASPLPAARTVVPAQASPPASSAQYSFEAGRGQAVGDASAAARVLSDGQASKHFSPTRVLGAPGDAPTLKPSTAVAPTAPASTPSARVPSTQTPWFEYK